MRRNFAVVSRYQWLTRQDQDAVFPRVVDECVKMAMLLWLPWLVPSAPCRQIELSVDCEAAGQTPKACVPISGDVRRVPSLQKQLWLPFGTGGGENYRFLTHSCPVATTVPFSLSRSPDFAEAPLSAPFSWPSLL